MAEQKITKTVKPELVEKKGPTPNGGTRALGVFVDGNNKPTTKALAKFFIVKEFKNEKPICSSLFKIENSKLKFIKTVTFKK